MRKETAFITSLLFFTFCSALFIVLWALPGSETFDFPKITGGFMEKGPVWSSHALNQQEIHKINEWLQGHNFAWKPVKGVVPSSGDARFILQNDKGEDIILTVWTGLSAADWNNTITITFPKSMADAQTDRKKDRKNVRGGGLAERANKIAYDGFYGQYMQTFSTKVFAPIRLMVNGFPVSRTWYP
ncbi:MAG: hypothetical protein IJ934_02085 [Acetobacter sp.]|nr:hypothetical protein [Acetobacter sp.]MBR2123958.1 hypothetical protein [Acetobacter sp.]